MKRSILIHLILFLMLFSGHVWGSDGHESGNGGHGVTLEFVLLGNDVYRHLKSLPDNIIFSMEQMDSFYNFLKSAKIYVTQEPLCYSNTTCQIETGLVAKNYPLQNKIEINEIRWQQLGYWAKLALVVHEYLGLMGIESNTFYYTSVIVKSMDQPSIKVDFAVVGNQNQFMIKRVLLAGQSVIIRENAPSGSFFSLGKILCHMNGLKSSGLRMYVGKKPKSFGRYMLYNETDGSFKMVVNIHASRQQYRVVSDLGCSF